MNYDLDKIKAIIKQTAQAVLLPRFASVERSYKPDGSVVSEADHEMQRLLQEQLIQLYADTLLLGEEMSTEEQAHILTSDKPIWCLDPLDGSNNFTAGVPYFSVSLALIYQGEVKLGVVYDPIRDECFSASATTGSQLNGEQLRVEESGLGIKQSIAIVDFKRLSKPLATRLVTEMPYASQRSFGSVALDWCWLAKGRCHLYLHGRSNIWDYAAGQYIFDQAGGYSCTLSGERVFKDALQPRSIVAATDKHLFDAWSHWLGISAS
jgi:myo-inositol-1(or 4)-monophosphatase